MKRSAVFLATALFGFSVSVPLSAAAEAPISRRDGFVLIWQSTSRKAEKTKEKPYADVPSGSAGFAEITYAKARGLLADDQEKFFPDETMTPSDALRWIFRTRSVEPINEDGTHDQSQIVQAEDVPLLATHYEVSYDAEGTKMTREQLLDLMRDIDGKLAKEDHEVSLYSEKFHGKGTAFGESFDMYAMTAAHRTFAYNTLVKVTNIDNGKSVVVRINDRGPYVEGRDMDLSLGAFTTIAERSKGKIRATFERLGDAELVMRCQDDRFQRRITKDVQIRPGIPHSFALGRTLSLTSVSPFVIRDLVYPDGVHTDVQTWVTKGESFDFTPSIAGSYTFVVGTKTGRLREMTMNVVDCSLLPQH